MHEQLVLLIISHLSAKLKKFIKLKKYGNIRVIFGSDSRSHSNTADEQISQDIVLKQVYSKLNDNAMAEVKYFLLCVLIFPVSDAIVESRGLTFPVSDAIVESRGLTFPVSDAIVESRGSVI